MGKAYAVGAVAAAVLVAGPAFGQATARPCGVEAAAGPACLMAHQNIAVLPEGDIYWHLDTFPSKAAAEAAASKTGSVVAAFGKVWLFTIEGRGWRPPQGGTHVADIGPLPVTSAASYSAEYLRSVFTPGMTAPLHVHSGPEAFYALTGDTCLETPAGARQERRPGNSLVIEGGPPMLLMAIGTAPRHGFALILHDAARPPTTLIQDWQPQGLCAQQFARDQAQ
ncbi:hypothetical protein [Nitrospirillum viridazoti]|uniref:hypothetical protein n=1 Tax=Nitrospirillum viridazoti TaxID=3144925 RepID=UPI0011A8D9D5|nr:hypothetical protein [Nitrospirillum amazonense]TWB29564.1 hypothetical protein FBZ91_12563 [Nitrospirillum amazonense]